MGLMLQGGGGSLILDTHGSADFGVSLFRLRAGYIGDCCKVLKVGGGYTEIPYLVSGGVDQSALNTHCGSGVGKIMDWHSNGLTANKFSTTDEAEMPTIWNDGMIFDGLGNPSVYWNGSNILRSENANNFDNSAEFTVACWIQGITGAGVHVVGSGSASDNFLETYGSGLVVSEGGYPMGKTKNAGYVVEGSTDLTGSSDVHVLFAKMFDNDGEIWLNNSSEDTDSSAVTSPYSGYGNHISLGASTGNGSSSAIDGAIGYIGGAIGWIADKSAARGDLQTFISDRLTMT